MTPKSSTQVCKELDLSYRQLDYWIRQGILENPDFPHGMGSQGSGNPRYFIESDIALLKATKNLLAAGVSLKQVKRNRSIDIFDPHMGTEFFIVRNSGVIETSDKVDTTIEDICHPDMINDMGITKIVMNR